MLHYDTEEFSDTQPLSNIMYDESTKAYACMLPRVKCKDVWVVSLE